jgi:4,5-dihydroxyphthalate decarboxylase
LPWIAQELGATQTLMGENCFSYGVETIRKSLEALSRYAHDQGLASRELMLEELFVPSTLELVESGD